MTVVQVVIKTLDVGLQEPAPFHLHEELPQVTDRLVRRSSGTEAVRASQKVLFVNGLQHHRNRPLEDFVLEGRHPNRPRLRRVTPFRDIDPANRRGLVLTRLEAVQEALEILFQAFRIGRCRQAIYTWSAVFAREAVGFPQKFYVDVVGQAHEDPLAIFPRQLCYPLKSR